MYQLCSSLAWVRPFYPIVDDPFRRRGERFILSVILIVFNLMMQVVWANLIEHEETALSSQMHSNYSYLLLKIPAVGIITMLFAFIYSYLLAFMVNKQGGNCCKLKFCANLMDCISISMLILLMTVVVLQFVLFLDDHTCNDVQLVIAGFIGTEVYSFFQSSVITMVKYSIKAKFGTNVC